MKPDLRRIPVSLRACLRAVVGLCLCAALGVGLGRTVVWSTTGSLETGLSGHPEIYVWDENLDGFGGYSGLIVDQDGAGFTAGSDRRHYLTGTLVRDGAGKITGTRDVTRWPVRYGTPDTMTAFKGDLEALSPLPDGRIAMAFEGYVRVQIVPNPGAAPTDLHLWNTFETAFGNTAFEALATLPKGSVLAVFEHGTTQNHTDAYLFEGASLSGPHPFPVTPGFDVSGADTGPDGCLYILERRYGVFRGFQFQLIRMDPDRWDAPRRLLYRSKPMALGNGEGLSVWMRGQSLVATVITDNGFPPFAPTRLIELPLDHDQALTQARGCADQ